MFFKSDKYVNHWVSQQFPAWFEYLNDIDKYAYQRHVALPE